MSNAKTESEAVINQSPELNESLVEENTADAVVEPTISADQEPAVLSDQEILDSLQPKVENKPKPSRKTKAIERSVKNFNQAIDEDGALDFNVLMREYEKNPKGLSTFAEVNGFDLESLEEAIDSEKNHIKSEYEEKISSLEEKLSEYDKRKAVEEFQGTIKSLVASSDLTLGEFNSQYGEDFNLFVTAFMQQGKDSKEAIELAYNKVVPPRTAEKDELLATEKSLPLGKAQVKTKEIGLKSMAEVNSLPDKERFAYKAKFRDPQTKVVKYA